MVAACFAAAPTPRDPSAVFAAIEGSIAAQDYYKADFLLGSLMDDLLSVGVPPLTGQAYRRAADSGRENGDLVGLVQQARLTWSQAARDEQPWAQVMVRLFIAFSSAVALDSQLPPTVRYEQARTRYEAAPSIILLHQLTRRAFEAGEYAATSKYLIQERAETSHAYPPEAAGLILHRLETLTGILKLGAGDVAGAIQALTDSARALQQYRAGRRLREAPRMLLAVRLLRAGQSAPVLAYLEVCAQFEYPGGEEYTDEGRNPHSPSQMISAIRAGVEPQFSGLDIY
ncbi:MAG TPA: hypothetical protein VNH18_18685 [Bryobacteraceae bacterium]|nr:hypothetical protein [Bryobacteraceae bacterium]